MGKRMLGFAPRLLIRHNFDNLARLDDLARRNPPPLVVIFHGADDEVIPVRMGRMLAERHPLMTRFHELPGVRHNDILEQIPPITSAMLAE
jgi:pimeloyl-ACP methyl ester carboxylesterase